MSMELPSKPTKMTNFGDILIWDNLKIGSTPIGEVLQDSLIISMD